jgi:hypothetical protein
MPEKSIFIDGVDERVVVSFMLDQGARLVASHQPRSKYSEISTWESYAAARQEERLFFVLFDCYERCPLVTHRIDGGYYEGTYSIEQRVGGPTIDLLISVQYEKEGRKLLSDGSLSYYPTYKDTRTGEMEDPPDLLIMQYKAITKELKKAGKVIRGKSGRPYIIGAHTYHALKSGSLHLGVAGLNID